MNDNGIVISELNVKNVKGIKSVSFCPNSGANTIGGNNGQGKSSLLDSIILTLKQKQMGHYVENIIHEGEDFAETEITFSDGNKVYSRWYKDGKRELRFSTESEGNLATPQKAIDAKLSGFGFDPTRFFGKSKEEQYDEILKLTDLDLNETNKTLTELKLKRRDQKNEVDRLKKVLSEYIDIEPVEEVSAQSVSEELQKAQEFNSKIEVHESEINSLNNSKSINLRQIESAEEQIKSLESQILNLKNRIEIIETDNVIIDRKINDIKIQYSNQTKLDLTPFKEKLSEISSINQRAIDYKRYLNLLNEEKIAVNDLNAIEELIGIERQKKIDAINRLNLIDGLGVDEENRLVTVNDIPIKQLSSSEQMIFATKLAMKTSPEYKILILQNASLLDKKTIREIINYVTLEGWQIFIEKVGIGEVIISEGVMLSPVEKEKYIKEYLED